MTSNNSSETPIRLGRMDRVMDYLENYRDWFVRQGDRRFMLTTIGLGAAGLLAVYGLGRLLVWMISSMFTPDPPPAAAAERPEPLAVTAQHVLDYIAGAVQVWSAQHPVGAADPGLVAGLWGLAGVVLLVFAGLTRLGMPLFAAWGAATVWTVYEATGTGNPVPAALAAAGIATAWCLVNLTVGSIAALFR